MVIGLLKLGMQFKLFYIVSLALGQHNANVFVTLNSLSLFYKQFCFSVLETKFSAYSMGNF